MIDLHAGIHEGRRSADIYCGESLFLDAFRRTRKAGGFDSEGIRLFRIVEDFAERRDAWEAGYPVCRSFIPEVVWQGGRYLYVGVEIYLKRPGEGSPEDWGFTRRIVGSVCEAYLAWRMGSEEKQGRGTTRRSGKSSV